MKKLLLILVFVTLTTFLVETHLAVAADGTITTCTWKKIGESWCTNGSEKNCTKGNDCDPNTGKCVERTCGSYCGLVSYNGANRKLSHSYYVTGYSKQACPDGKTGVYEFGSHVSLGCWNISNAGSEKKHTTDWILDTDCAGYESGYVYCGNQALPKNKWCTYTAYSGACIMHVYQTAKSANKVYDGVSCVDDSPWCDNLPVAKITSPLNNAVFGVGSAITFTGEATDADGDALTYAWAIDGNTKDYDQATVSDQASFSVSDLAFGKHTAQFWAKTDTANSKIVSVAFEIVPIVTASCNGVNSVASVQWNKVGSYANYELRFNSASGACGNGSCWYKRFTDIFRADNIPEGFTTTQTGKTLVSSYLIPNKTYWARVVYYDSKWKEVSGSDFADTTFVALNCIPAPTVTQACSGSSMLLDIKWDDAGQGGNGYAVDISETETFTKYWNKSVAVGTTATQAPAGFVARAGETRALKIESDKTYYIRIYYVKTKVHSQKSTKYDVHGTCGSTGSLCKSDCQFGYEASARTTFDGMTYSGTTYPGATQACKNLLDASPVGVDSFANFVTLDANNWTSAVNSSLAEPVAYWIANPGGTAFTNSHWFSPSCEKFDAGKGVIFMKGSHTLNTSCGTRTEADKLEDIPKTDPRIGIVPAACEVCRCPAAPNCIGGRPDPNSTLCDAAGDNELLTANKTYFLTQSCSAARCEYVCSANYHYRDDGTGGFCEADCLPNCRETGACDRTCGSGTKTLTCDQADCSGTYNEYPSCNTQACPSGWIETKP